MRSITLVLVLLVVLSGCAGVEPLPAVQPPAAGYWFDAFRARRARLRAPELLAGSAKVRLTPRRRGVRIAGHGHWHKTAKGVLDDIWGRVLYLDSGRGAVALVSLDFIGFMLPRVERVRARVTREHPGAILIVSTHNHAGPDTVGLWGPALMGMLPVRCGIDRDYLAWVEERVAGAILEAVASSRPARLYAGRFEMPQGLAVNMREPGDVPRRVTVLRAAAEDGTTIATVVNYANHAESLQDKGRWLSADFPGVLYREVDRALGGVTLFVSAPAGGMIEPANHPDDPERARLAFRERLGGALAAGVIQQAIAGMQELARPAVRLRTRRFRLPVEPGGLVDLAMSLKLLEPRPLVDGHIVTEAAYVDLGEMQLVTVPGEPTPAVGRRIERGLRGPYRMILTLGMDELAYILTDEQWRDPRFVYERSDSLGPRTFRITIENLRALMEGGAH